MALKEEEIFGIVASSISFLDSDLQEKVLKSVAATMMDKGYDETKIRDIAQTYDVTLEGGRKKKRTLTRRRKSKK